MNYKINFNNYKNNFSLPALIVEDDLKNINSDYLKVILMIFKNPDKSYSINLLSNLLNLSEAMIKSALHYWIDKGVLLSDVKKERQIHVISKTHAIPAKQTNDSELKYLLLSMETVLKRTVTSTDIKTITYIYEYYRLPADVILMAIQYAVEKGKNSMKYIERLCVAWYDKGITNHTLAEEYLKLCSLHQNQTNQIKRIFGISGRALTSTEKASIKTWLLEYQFPMEMIQLAYEKTVQNTGKLAFAYINKILLNWNEKGYKTLEDVQNGEQNYKKTISNPSIENSYDIDEFEKHLNKIPTLD